MSAAQLRCFVGGWGTGDEIWRGVMQELDKATAPLKPTEGLNGPPAVNEPAHFVSWLQCVQDWPGVMARLAALPGQLVLVGWSLGSVLALRAASDGSAVLEQKIAAMVLVSATSRMCASTGESHDDGGIDPRVLAAMRARMRRSPEAVLEDFAAECAAPDGDELTREHWLQQARQYACSELIAGLDALATLDVREGLSKIAVPCRILHGECDRIVPLRSAQTLAGRIAAAKLQVLAGRGHALPFTAAAEIAQCITSVG